MEDDHEEYVEGEEDQPIDWDSVLDLEERFSRVNAIEDPDERLAAAKALAEEMAGE